MKRYIQIIGILFSSLSVGAQTDEPDVANATTFERETFSAKDFHDPLFLLMAYDSSLDWAGYTKIRTDLKSFSESLVRRRHKFESEGAFIKFVFRETHKEYLHEYLQYAPFNEVFYSGTYNCLSGTALYSHILTALGFETRIFETRYHCFLTIDRDGKPEWLIESTDRHRGITEGNLRVVSRIAEYQRKENEIRAGSDTLLLVERPLLTIVQFKELAALQYFNLAVVAFNAGRYETSLSYLARAEILYPGSQRIANLIAYARSCAPIISTDSPISNQENTISSINNQNRK